MDYPYNEKSSNSIFGFRDNKLSSSAPAYDDPPPAPSYHTKFALMSFHMTDRIRLLRFNVDEANAIQSVIQQHWRSGIQDVRPYGQAKEFKLSGRPWSSRSDRPYARRLVCRLLECLYNQGWVLKASVDISKKEYDTDSIIFHYRQPTPPPCYWLSISFDQGDRLTLLDAPQAFVDTLVQTFGRMVQRQQALGGGAYEIKFVGYPWRASGEETVMARILVLQLLDCLEIHGFSLYASIDQDRGAGGDSHTTEADAWYCCRHVDWQPGMPVYHD